MTAIRAEKTARVAIESERLTPISDTLWLFHAITAARVRRAAASLREIFKHFVYRLPKIRAPMEKPRQRLRAFHRPSGLESDAPRTDETDESQGHCLALQPLVQTLPLQ